MSSLDFLSNLAKKVSNMTLKPSAKIASKKTTKKHFTHTNNIIMKRGTYKGYYGFVYEFFPAKYEVEIDEESYVPVIRYGQKKIGETFLTEFGNAKVLNRIPTLYGIKVDNEEIRFPREDLLHITYDSKNNKLLLINSVSFENEDKLCKGIVLDIKGNSEKEMLDNLSKAIKTGIYNIQNKSTIDIKCHNTEYYFVITKPQQASLINHQGQYGTLLRVIDEQYHITYKKRIMLSMTEVTKTNKKSIAIKKGPYKNKTGYIISKHVAYLTVYIDAIGRRVNNHMVKEGDKFVQKPITPNDVFYMDLKLKNNNFFEVKTILDNGNMIGLEKTYNDFIPREISMNDIAAQQPGFSFTEVQHVSFIETDKFQSDTDESLVVNDDDDDDNVSAIDYNEELLDEIIEDPVQFQHTFKDTERTSFVPKQLTKEESEIKTKIDNILNTFGIADDINVYDIIEESKQSILKIKTQLKNAKISFWKGSDEKYVIAVLVLYQIIKKGYTSLIGGETVLNYIAVLSNKKYFHAKDVAQSVFLTNGWSNHFTVNTNITNALYKSKSFQDLYKIVFENCHKVLQTFFGNIDIHTSNILHYSQLIPLGGPKKSNARMLLTVKDIVNNNIPSTANSVLWGIEYRDTLEKYQRNLVKVINHPKANKTTQIVYEYVLDNLENAPIILANWKNTNLKIDNLKKDTLSKTFEKLMQEITRIYNDSTNKRKERIETIEQNKESLKKRRRDIYEQNELLGKFASLDLDLDLESNTSLKKTRR